MRWGSLLIFLCAWGAALAPADAAAQLFGGRFRIGARGAGDKPPAPAVFASAPKDPQQWLGMKVMPRTPTAAFGLPDRPMGHASDVAPWPQTVKKVQGSWLWIETPTAQGWLGIQDAVPFADAILYFNGLLARRPTTWDYYMRGSALRELERFDETFRDFKALEAIEAKQIKALSKQADAQIKKDDYRGLIATTTQMERMCPDNVTIFTSRGAAYMMLNDLVRAKADFDHAVELAASTETYLARSKYYRQQGDLVRAIDDLDKAIYHWPFIRLYEARAECLIDCKEYVRAIDDLNVALASDPRKVANYLLRARAYLASGKIYEANLDFSTAIQLAPTAETYQEAAMARHFCSDFRRAIDDASMAIRLNPKLYTPYLVRGYAYTKLNRYSEAKADFDRAIQTDPKETGAYIQRGMVSLKLKDPDQALKDGSQAYRLGDRSKSCVLLAGLVHLTEGTPRRGVELMDEALRADPTFQEAYTLRSVAAWMLGDDAQARADAIEAKLYSASDADVVSLDLALDVFGNQPLESRMSTFLADFGMPERAKEVATQAIAKSPQLSGGYYARGVARARLRDYDGARQDLMAALARDPSNALTFRQLANCSLKQDRFDDLIVEATRVLALEGPSFIAFTIRAWAWRHTSEPERVIEDTSDALTFGEEADEKRTVAECYLLRSEAYKKLGQQALSDADRKVAEGVSSCAIKAWEEMIRREERERVPTLFVHAANGENLRKASSKSAEEKTTKKDESLDGEVSLRLKKFDTTPKLPAFGAPSAFR